MCRVLLFGGATLLAASLARPGPGSVGASGELTKGEAAFVRQCALCHTVWRGEPNRYGPNLFGIVNSPAASVPGFEYSSAFKSAALWDWSPDVLAACPLNGPGAELGNKCPEGWTFYPLSCPGFRGASGAAETPYYVWVDQHNILGLGANTPIATGNQSDALHALVSGRSIELRVPYPMGFFCQRS